MVAKSKRIKGKLLWEAYTPVESDADGYSDGKDFSAIVGNKRFHSFQVWREVAGGSPTCVYGLTLKQIEKIRSQADEGLIAENILLKKQLEIVEALVHKLGNPVTGMEAVRNQPTLIEENSKLKEERQWLHFELRQYQKRQTGNFVSDGSIRAVSIPMGGAPGYKIKQRRR